MMQAIGMIETKGLLAAVESADSMTKSAKVKILEKIYVGGGLVTIVVAGDVGAVKAAVDVGKAAVIVLGEGLLISSHVIAKPHEDLSKMMKCEEREKIAEISYIEEIVAEDFTEKNTAIKEEIGRETKEITEESEGFTEKADIEEILLKSNFEKDREQLTEKINSLKISELRKIVKGHKDSELTTKVISKMTKENLVKKVLALYKI